MFVTSLSGVSCPGLIEAWPLGIDGGQAASPYPGFLAPASLKHGDGPHKPGAGGSYPGFLAPASLKRDTEKRLAVAQPPYPGFLAPASLKPAIGRHWARPAPELIRGFLPRPH